MNFLYELNDSVMCYVCDVGCMCMVCVLCVLCVMFGVCLALCVFYVFWFSLSFFSFSGLFSLCILELWFGWNWDSDWDTWC
ncbi:hypothetical protein BJX62DRAFT_220994 [Aspergillus germanicus]